MSSSDGWQWPEAGSESAAVRTRLQTKSTRIKREETDATIRKLEASGELSEHERAVIEKMADRIVIRLLGPSITALEGRTDADSVELAALSRLFEPWTNRDDSE